jgi:thioredoxin 1
VPDHKRAGELDTLAYDIRVLSEGTMPIDAPIHTNESNLGRVLNVGLPVLLVFWQRDCAPCDQLAPVLDRVARAYAGRALIVKVNVAEEPGLAARYHITALPSIVIIKDGRDQATAQGAASEAELAAWLDHLSGGAARPPVPSGPSVVLASASAGRGAYAGPEQPVREAAPASAPTGAPGGAANKPVVLTDANFEQMIRSSRVPVLVDFWAVWCGPCRMVAPVVEQLAQDYAGRALVGKLNVDENPGVAGKYGIMSIPTLMIFRNGQAVDRIVGAQPAPVIRQHLAKQVE